MTEDEGNDLLAQTAWVHSLAKSVVARHDLAADVAQETLMVALRRGLSGVLDVRSFLAQILRRLARRRVQGETVRQERERALPPREPVPAAGDVVAKAALQREVVDAALRLDEPYRTAVLLRFLEDRSYQEIAVATGAPLETVRTRIKRGLQQVRQDLDRRHGEVRAWALPILGLTGFQEAVAAASAGAAGAASTAAAGAAGVLAMSMQAKMMAAAGALLAGILAWQVWPDAGAAAPDAGSVVGIPAAAAGSQPAGPAPSVLERTTVSPAAPEPPAQVPAAAGPEWTARGRVVAEVDNRGIAAAGIRFVAGSCGHMAAGVDRVVSAADGSFEFTFERSCPGFLELEITHADYAMAHVPLLEIVARSEAAGNTAAAIGDVALVSGEALAGRVLAADGATPVPHARILRYRATFGVPMRVFAEAVEVGTADANGRFALPFRVGPGYRREWLLAMTDAAIGWRELLPSRRAAQNDHFDLVMRPVARLRMRAVDTAGKPIAGATAVAMPECYPLGSQFDPWRMDPLPQPLPPFLRGSTGPDGCIELVPPIGDDEFQHGDKVPGGRLLVAVGLEGHRRWNQTLELRIGETRDVEAKLIAGTATAVAGIVFTRDGLPIAGAEVTIGKTRAVTDAAGRFRAERVDVAAGQVAVQAAAKGFVTSGTTVVCGDDAKAEVAVELRLDPVLIVRGIVVDQDGQPVEGAVVFQGPGPRVQSDAGGRFELAASGRRMRTLIVMPPDGRHDFPGTFTPIPDPLPAELRITVQKNRGGARVEITLQDRASGRALEPLQGWLYPLGKDGQMVGAGRQLQVRDGMCFDREAPAGRYRLEVETRDSRKGQRDFDVPAGVPLVSEQLLFDPASTITCTLDVTSVPALPQQLRIELVPGNLGKLRVRGRANKQVIGEWAVLVAPERERELEVVDAQPGAEFRLRIMDEAVAGEVSVVATPGAAVAVTLRAQPAGRLQFACKSPATFEMIVVYWRRADGEYSSALQLLQCKGKRDLGAVAVPAGTVAWRVGFLPEGGEPQSREGTVFVPAGGAAVATIE